MAGQVRRYGSQSFQEDTIETSAGPLVITFLGHGTLMMSYAGLAVHVDPWQKVARYEELPRAHVILVTHHHHDHLDPEAIAKLRRENTEILFTELCAKEVPGGRVLHNGERASVHGITVEAVPAYNIRHRRPSGELFHPPGEGNGYLIDFADKRVYVAGDTEDTPEMRALRGIDIAFLPMNLPYTMSPEMVAAAARAFKPKILYPYHTGDTNARLLVELLADTPEVQVRLRRMS